MAILVSTGEEERDKPKRMRDDRSLTFPTLPNEIWSEIITNLSVKDVLRCKSVCKGWNKAILLSPFIKNHLERCTTKIEGHRLMISTLKKITSCSVLEVLEQKRLKVKHHEEFTQESSVKSIYVAGSCNGLVLVEVNGENLYVWNPAIKLSQKIPYSGFKTEENWYVLHGFGCVGDEYRIVSLFHNFTSKGKNLTEVRIYSSRTRLWKVTEDFPEGTLLDGRAKFCSSCLNWPASLFRISRWEIVSFHLKKEKYKRIPQPHFEDDGYKVLTLGTLNDSLSLLCSYPGVRAEVWVMKVYRLRDSWLKVVCIPYLNPYSHRFGFPMFMTNGKILLQTGIKVMLYDSNTCALSEIGELGQGEELTTYYETLVSPREIYKD